MIRNFEFLIQLHSRWEFDLRKKKQRGIPMEYEIELKIDKLYTISSRHDVVTINVY